MVTFERAGYENTEQALTVLQAGVRDLGVRRVVVASTSGATGLAAARRLHGSGVAVVVVTHNYGFKDQGILEMSGETRLEIEGLGAKVHTGTMPFRTTGTAVREKGGCSIQDAIANTLRLLGQGLKVCVEIVLMAADAGLTGTEDLLAMAGTARGADTVALIRPASSNRLFDLMVREILAKPRDW